MSGEKLESMDVLLRRIAPQVIPCPRSMILDALQTIAVDFFRETGVWTATFQDTASPCDPVITLSLPKGAVMGSVQSVALNGVLLESGGYTEGTRDITLNECPTVESLVVIKASLRPLRTTTALPEDLLEEYGDYLAFGAIAKLKAMSGQHVEWSDAQGASTNYQLYQDGVKQAKARKFRKRFGGGILYVNTEL